MTVKERYLQQRLIPTAMEPRGVALRGRTPSRRRHDLDVDADPAHPARLPTRSSLGIPEAKLRVIAPDVGGGFGSKLDVYAEELLVLALAQRLGRPVKWTEERSEANAGHDPRPRRRSRRSSSPPTADGKITGVRARLTAAMGAYLQLVTPGIPLLGAWLYAGCYDVEAYDFHCTGVFTNTTPTDAYRGAGRPEATYAIERADRRARPQARHGPGRDPPAQLHRLRSRPTSPPGCRSTPATTTRRSTRALELLGYDARARRAGRRAATRGDTKQLGIGFSTYVEMCGLAPSRILGALRYGAGGWESATVRVLPTGTVQVVIRHVAARPGPRDDVRQIVADRLGVDVDDVEVLHGDTAVVADRAGHVRQPQPRRSAASRSTTRARRSSTRRGRSPRTSSRCPRTTSSTRPARSRSRAAPTRAMHVKEIAFAAWAAHNLPDGMEPGLEASVVYDPPNFSWPAGCHIAVVEVDTETGDVRLDRYVAVDDVGNVINPMIVDGQVHGGIAQGVAQALWEEAVYDEDGNLVTGSLLNYLVPSAAELPSFELDRTVTPSPTNPLGVKGVGETGTIASTPAVVNAVIDALAPFGVTDIDMPTTPERVWRAIEEATRMIPAAFDYELAESVEEAVELLGSREDAKLLAGGHSLIPAMKLRIARPGTLVDIGRLERAELRARGRRRDRDRRADAASRRGDERRCSGERCAIVASAAAEIGDPQVRHRGHDRRLRRARRPGVRHAGRAAGARRRVRRSSARAASGRSRRRSSSPASSRRRSASRTC